MSVNIPGRYEPVGEVLSGGQGDVTICRDTHLKRRVAVKVVKEIDDLDRLKKEISILQALRCKHVVEILDLIDVGADGEIGLVEEYLPGQDLEHLVEAAESGSPVSGDEFLKIAFQMASGIAEIHDHGVVHRDFKTNNVKFDEDGFLRIFDFGFSKGVSDAPTEGFGATVGFAAPELFQPGEKKIEPQVDIYALGVTCHLLLTGQYPDGALVIPPMPWTGSFSSLIDGANSEVAECLDRCLDMDPAQRPTAEEIRDVLERQLVRGRHVGMLCSRSNQYRVEGVGAGVKITTSGNGTAVIRYDGLDFRITDIDGDVYINASAASDGDVLPSASVLTFGAPEKQGQRSFFTFDVSHPEVVL